MCRWIIALHPQLGWEPELAALERAVPRGYHVGWAAGAAVTSLIQHYLIYAQTQAMAESDAEDSTSRNTVQRLSGPGQAHVAAARTPLQRRAGERSRGPSHRLLLRCPAPPLACSSIPPWCRRSPAPPWLYGATARASRSMASLLDFTGSHCLHIRPGSVRVCLPVW
jgi:hypothetical protein